jgi:glucan biosynthesis protein
VVEQSPNTTPPTEKIVNDRRGVMGWTFDLAPNAGKDIILAYRMKWPADREIMPDSPTTAGRF